MTFHFKLKLLLALLATVLGLLLGEGLTRWLKIGPGVYSLSTRWFRLSPLPGVDYEFRPLVPFGSEPINADSMRDRPRDVRKNPGTYRVACIGDSICMGLGVSAAQCFSRVWENNLREKGIPAEVLNFGVPGYNLREIMAALRDRTLKYAPDMVVYAYCLNDIQEESFELEELEDHLSPAQRDFWERATQHGKSWLARSRLFNLLRYGLLASFSRPAPLHVTRPEDDPQFKAILDGHGEAYFQELYNPSRRAGLCAALREFAELGRHQDFKPVLAIFPLPARVAGPGLGPVYDFVTAAAREAGLTVVDLRDDFAKVEQMLLFVDPLHPGVRGHRIAAEALHRELAAFLPADSTAQRPGPGQPAN